MPDVTVNIEVYCSCGNGLCAQTETSQNRRGNPVLTITPCGDCLSAVRSEGYDEGYDEGR